MHKSESDSPWDDPLIRRSRLFFGRESATDSSKWYPIRDSAPDLPALAPDRGGSAQSGLWRRHGRQRDFLPTRPGVASVGRPSEGTLVRTHLAEIPAF